jgi:hypothetical protein
MLHLMMKVKIFNFKNEKKIKKEVNYDSKNVRVIWVKCN